MEKEKDFFEEDFNDKYGIYKHLVDVHSDIKKDITSDFILAKLKNDQAPVPEPIIELVRDAYFCKKMIERYAEAKEYKVDARGKWIKEKDGTYKKYPISDEKIKYIKNEAKIIFNVYMIKVIMTVIMYRNIKENVIMELITEREKYEAEIEKAKQENANVGETIKKNIKKSGKED